MPTERVLIEIVTAANMAGVEQAQAGFLGFTPQVLLAGGALAGLVFVGKSAVENYEKQQQATLDLQQAYKTQKDTLAAHQKQVNDFLDTNKHFISDQYDTQAALANVVRAGLNPGKEAFRVLGDALDLSAIKHGSVSDAATMIIKAEAGTAKGLRDLGITTGDYSKIMNDKTLPDAEKHRQLLALIEGKTKDGRKATTDLQKSQNDLNKDWQDFTARIGPAVVKGLDVITRALDDEVKQVDQLVGGLGTAIGFAGKILGGDPAMAARVSAARAANPRGARASGGDVAAYGTYTVGEAGPETLVMGSQGGSIVPNGGMGSDTSARFLASIDAHLAAIRRKPATAVGL